MATRTTTETTRRDLDPLFLDPIEKIIRELGTLYDQGYQPYEGQRIQDFTPDQLAYMEKVRELQGYGADAVKSDTDRMQELQRYTPERVGIRELGQVGTDFTPQQTTAGAFDSQAAQQYMNPYIENVLDRQRERMFRADDIARQGRDARAVQSGAFGGSRQGVVEAEAAKNLQDRMADQEAQALAQAYQSGANIFKTDADRSLTAQRANQAAGLKTDELGLRGDIANLQGDMQTQKSDITAQRANQAAGLSGAGLGLKASAGIGGLLGQGQALTGQQLGMLSGVGGAQQQMGQAGLDMAYSDFERQRMFPYEQLNYFMGGLQGFPSSMIPGTTTTTGQTPTLSNTARLAGLGINALGLYGQGGGFDGGFSFSNLFPYG